MPIRRHVRAFVVLLGVSAFAGRAEAQSAIVDLTGAGTAQHQFANAVNEAGIVVGWVQDGTLNSAAAWIGGTIQILPDFCDLCSSQAMGINDLGDIAGTAWQLDGTRRAVVWRGGSMIPLEPLAGDSESSATDINNLGIVVGSSGNGSQTSPVRWHNDVPEFLGGSDPPLLPATAHAINEAGDVVGIASGPLGGKPFIWSNGVLTELESGGATGPANDVNDDGVVVGLRIVAAQPIATMWVGGVRSDVASPWSNASGINNRGQIVGYSGTGFATLAGTLWQNGSSTILGGQFVTDINETGVAVGTGIVEVDGVPYNHAFLFQLETPQSVLEQILTTVSGIGPGSSLADKVESAIAAFESGDTAGAQAQLNALLKQVQAQTGKKLTPAQAAEIQALVARLRELLDA